MAMSKKDYVAIAAVFNGMITQAREAKIGGPGVRAQIVVSEALANMVADVMAQDSERFDRARFLAACGVAS